MTIHIDHLLKSRLEEELRHDGIEAVVVGAVIKRDGKVLLLERTGSDEFGGLVELPSGHLDPNESWGDALEREIREETGLPVIALGRFLGAFDYSSGSGKKARQLNFEASVQTGAAVLLNPSEHQAHFWVNPSSNTFDQLNISLSVRGIIAAAFG